MKPAKGNLPVPNNRGARNSGDCESVPVLVAANRASCSERHDAGDAEIEIQLSEERLIVNVRIEETRNDEFSRQVHTGGAGRNRRRASAEGRDLVPFNHDDRVWHRGSGDDVDDRSSGKGRAIRSGDLLRENNSAECRGGQHRKHVGAMLRIRYSAENASRTLPGRIPP